MMMLLLIACIATALPGGQAVESLRLFIIGDMGGVDIYPYSTFIEQSTAKEMGQLADLYSPQVILELGDNFYYSGVKNLDDPRFNLTFESVYTAQSLQVPWYLVAGNHDHVGNVTAQILYSQHSKRWNFPSFYYYREFPVLGTNTSVGIVFIDTVQLCGNTDDFSEEQPNGRINVKEAEDQWAFIQQTLDKSRTSYLFVAGHFPVYSVAEHGPTKCLIDQLQPMLEAYKVSGYLSGHDHNLQHLRVKSQSGAPIDYFVSGMANFIDNSTAHAKSVPAGSSLFHYANLFSKGGFLYAEATAKNMTFTFINAAGEQLYSTVVMPRKP